MIDKYKDYFRIIQTYHQSDPEKRPAMLAGFVFSNSISHPDPFTRGKIAHFYATESLRHAAKSQSPG